MKKIFAILLITIAFILPACGAADVSDTNTVNTDSVANITETKDPNTVVNNTEDTPVSASEYKVLCSGGYSFVLEDKDTVNIMQHTVEDKNRAMFAGLSYTWIDGHLYSRVADNLTAYKSQYKGNGFFETQDWITSDYISNTPISSNGAFQFPSTTSWNNDGEYIYFIYSPSREFFNASNYNAYRIFKASTDGTVIDYVGDAVAETMAIIDGWIYYFDNGCTYTGSEFVADNERVGIYKIKTDGTQKTLVYGNFDAGEYTKSYDFCSDFAVKNNDIYFIDGSAQGKSRVCKLDTETSTIEYLTQGSAYSFCVDDNNVYYVNGVYDEVTIDGRDITRVNLSDKSESKILSLAPQFNSISLEVMDGYLYVSSYNLRGLETENTKDAPGVLAKRFDVNTLTPESLFGYIDIKTEVVTVSGRGTTSEKVEEIGREYFAYWEKDNTYVNN